MDDNIENESEDVYPCAPAPPVEIKLFVARIPKTYEEAEIRKMFEEFGKVKEVVVIRDRNTSVHKCCAFVRMASISQADAAIRSLNNQCVVDTALGAVLIKYAVGEPERLGFTSLVGDAGCNDAKLFVGSLPKSCDEKFVSDIFSPFGTLDDVFIMKDSTTGAGKGCAFVKMAYKEQGLYAIRSLDGKRQLDGCSRPMEVRFAETKANKQVMLPTRVQIIQPPYAPVTIPNNSQPRQVGVWKEYISPEGKPYFYNEQTGHTQWERPPEFDHVNTVAPGGPPGANLFIFHIPNEWTHSDLVRTFSQFGKILSARIAIDKNTGRHRGYAFVSYDSAECAAQAISHMNGFTIMGKRLKVTIKKGEEHSVPSGVPGLGRMPIPPHASHPPSYHSGAQQYAHPPYYCSYQRYAPY